MKHEGDEHRFQRVIDRRQTDSIKWQYYDEDVLPLWVADMDFASPPEVVSALHKRVDHGIFGYPTEPQELRDVVCEWIAREYGWRVSVEALVFLPNVVVGFNLAARALTEPGDGLLIQTPIYFPILRVPGHAGLQENLATVTQGMDGRYEIDFRAFEAAITDRTRLFMLCNPHNPVGRVYTREELERMAEICLRHDVAVCSDEIHADFVFDGRRHVPVASLSPEIADRSVTLLSPNKTFNIAGIGCAIAVVPNSELRARLNGAKRGLVPHVGILAYAATLAAYRHGESWLRDMVAYLEANRDAAQTFAAEELRGISFTPMEGTYLAWLDCRESAISGNAQEFFLREARVAVNDGAIFGPGGEGFVRLNFGCPRSTLSEGLGRMKAALETL